MEDLSDVKCALESEVVPDEAKSKETSILIFKKCKSYDRPVDLELPLWFKKFVREKTNKAFTPELSLGTGFKSKADGEPLFRVLFSLVRDNRYGKRYIHHKGFELSPEESCNINRYLELLLNKIKDTLVVNVKMGAVYLDKNEQIEIQELCLFENSIGECSVCHEKTITHSDCGHYICFLCRANLNSNKCPLCREKISSNCQCDDDDEHSDDD
jgi:hypothetical protein